MGEWNNIVRATSHVHDMPELDKTPEQRLQTDDKSVWECSCGRSYELQWFDRNGTLDFTWKDISQTNVGLDRP